MTPLLVDASVWMAAVDSDDPRHESAAGLMLRASSAHDHIRLAALDLTLYEVGNVAAKRWGDAPGAQALANNVERLCQDRIVRTDSELIDLAAKLAVKHDVSLYDAAYAAASQVCKWPLLSYDVKDLVDKGLAEFPSITD